MSERLNIDDVSHIVHEAYIPFAAIERAIPWPNREGRLENDAEHSYSLALVGIALGERLGLDPARIAYYATVHDLPELYAGDTSVWDEKGRETKAAREEAAIEEIGVNFHRTPELRRAMLKYEELEDEESRFVYALDKLLAVLMIIENGGSFWKNNGISYEMHRKKASEMIEKVSVHPIVGAWYQELLEYIEADRVRLFATDEHRISVREKMIAIGKRLIVGTLKVVPVGKRSG